MVTCVIDLTRNCHGRVIGASDTRFIEREVPHERIAESDFSSLAGLLATGLDELFEDIARELPVRLGRERLCG